MELIKFPINLSIGHALNGLTWHMHSIDDDLFVSNKDYLRIVEICNEVPVYNLLFKDKLANKPYEVSKAHEFVEWAKEGWRMQNHFAFIIKDENNQIMAAVDIKSANLDEAEIGYWSSSQKPGIMTNAISKLIEIAKQAGYKKLFANTRKINQRSQGVLLRSGFKIENEFIKNDIPYYKFGRILD